MFLRSWAPTSLAIAPVLTAKLISPLLYSLYMPAAFSNAALVAGLLSTAFMVSSSIFCVTSGPKFSLFKPTFLARLAARYIVNTRDVASGLPTSASFSATAMSCKLAPGVLSIIKPLPSLAVFSSIGPLDATSEVIAIRWSCMRKKYINCVAFSESFIWLATACTGAKRSTYLVLNIRPVASPLILSISDFSLATILSENPRTSSNPALATGGTVRKAISPILLTCAPGAISLKLARASRNSLYISLVDISKSKPILRSTERSAPTIALIKSLAFAKKLLLGVASSVWAINSRTACSTASSSDMYLLAAE